MPDYIIIAGNEEELIDLANSLNKKYCGGAAIPIFHTEVEGGQVAGGGKVFIVGHANILGIGDYDHSEVRVFSAYFSSASEIYLAGCSTGDEKQQVRRNGFVASAPLASAVKERYKLKPVYCTPGTLCLRGDGSLYIEGGASQGAIGDTIFVSMH